MSEYLSFGLEWGGLLTILLPLLLPALFLQLLSSDNNLFKNNSYTCFYLFLVSIMSVIYTFEKYYFIQQFTHHTDEVTNEQDQLHKLTTQYSFTEREGESAALRFVAAGYQRLSFTISVCEKAAFPNALYDLAQTMCYLHQNAKKLCIDENKIVVCGFSAGGNVSASLG